MKKNYKILIPIMVVFVLLIAVYFLYREYKYDNYRNKKEVSVFQYFGGIKVDYTAIVTYNLKDIIIDISSKNKKIEYDSTPIYYTEEDKIIFPKEMTIVFPLESVSQYKLYKYSLYEKKNNSHFITMNNNTSEYKHFFLYDGANLFFFPEEVTLKIGDKEYKKLSAMSYVSVVGGYTMIYYDRESDTSSVIEIEGKKITVINEDMEVNLSEKHCLYFDDKVLLFSPYNLNAVNN